MKNVILLLTLVTTEHITSVLSISFNKNVASEKERAESLYSALREELGSKDIQPYRLSVDVMHGMEFVDKGKDQMLREIKRTFDPDNIISQGGIGYELL